MSFGAIYSRFAAIICAFVAALASGLSKDKLPGPYPKTPEERAAAAKKYNLTIEDYEPYPDKGDG